MSLPTATGLTYDDLWDLPQDDNLRRELIDGELYVSPSPGSATRMRWSPSRPRP